MKRCRKVLHSLPNERIRKNTGNSKVTTYELLRALNAKKISPNQYMALCPVMIFYTISLAQHFCADLLYTSTTKC
jgi:hypothetical protein